MVKKNHPTSVQHVVITNENAYIDLHLINEVD